MQKVLRKVLLVFIVLTQQWALLAQTSLKDYQGKVDSLERLSKKAKKSELVEIYRQQADNYLSMANYDESNAIAFYNRAIEIADRQFTIANELAEDYYRGNALFLKGQALASIFLYTGSSDTLDRSISLFNKSIRYLQKTDSLNTLAQAYNKLMVAHQFMNEFDSIIILSEKVLSFDTKKIKPRTICDIYYLKGIAFANMNDFPKAIETFLTLKNFAVNVDTLSISRSLNSLGSIEHYRGNYEQALNYFIESMRISERKKQSKDEAERLDAANEVAVRKINIGNVLKELNRNDEALTYYNEALSYFQGKTDIDSKTYAGQCLNNIGIIYQSLKKLEEAEAYYEEAIKISQEIKDSSSLMMNYINMGAIYSDKKQSSKAIDSYQRALRIAKAARDSKSIALIFGNIADVYQRDSKPAEAINFYTQSLKIAKEIGVKEIQKQDYEGLSSSYELLNDPARALQYYKLYSEVKDSLLNESNQRAVAQMKEAYESDKKDKENQLLKSNNEVLELQGKRDRLVKWGMGLIILMIVVFAIFVVIQLQEKKKKNKLLAEQNIEIQMQKEEIEAQRDEIVAQRDLLAKQKQEITDSIYYARRIQRAVIPSNQVAADLLPEHFILFKPRDIVSGDFYWIAKRENKTIVVDADCTGHGVPGAFMSMLGVSFLNEIVSNSKELQANAILNELRHYVKTTLGQTGKQDEAKDGMDIALCIIEWDTNTIQYAGAYNPLYYFKDGVFNEIKADKMPIGIYIKDNEPFTNNIVDFKKGDTFYIFSDGYVSQFGGADGRKFMSKPFKALLETIQPKPMEEQMQLLDKALLEWQGSYEQVDDISVIGFRF
jgi:serine phosphatase RsbU (regulator of sigma subunit)